MPLSARNKARQSDDGKTRRNNRRKRRNLLKRQKLRNQLRKDNRYDDDFCRHYTQATSKTFKNEEKFVKGIEVLKYRLRLDGQDAERTVFSMDK